jgi:hypothetical protein
LIARDIRAKVLLRPSARWLNSSGNITKLTRTSATASRAVGWDTEESTGPKKVASSPTLRADENAVTKRGS